MGRFSGKTCRLSVMLSLTFSFFFVEIVFGYLTNSMTLIADSFHMLSDVLALIIAFACMKISKKNASSKNTFGWVRAEVLGALVNAVFLMALCFSIFVEALKRIFEPESVEMPNRILIVGILGLAINIVGIFMFHGHSSVHGHSHARPVPLDLPRDDETSSQGPNVVPDPSPMSKIPLTNTVDSPKQTNVTLADDDESINQALGPIISEAHNICVLLDANVTEDEEGDLEAENVSNLSKMSNGGTNSKTLKSITLNDRSTPADKQLLHSKDGHKSKRLSFTASGQMNMHGVFLHILGDAFGSVIVVINAVVCLWTKDSQLSKYLDPSLSIAIALIITMTTLPLLKESAMVLLQTVPTHLNVQDMKSKLLKSVEGVLAIHEFHVWRLAGNKIIATAHIRTKNPDDYMRVAEQVKQFFHKEGIHSTTIQPEFLQEPNARVDGTLSNECVLECPEYDRCAPSTCCVKSSVGPQGSQAKHSLSSASRSVAADMFTGGVSRFESDKPDAQRKSHGAGSSRLTHSSDDLRSSESSPSIEQVIYTISESAR